MIAIDMKMPEYCEDCRFEGADGTCCAMPRDFTGSTWDSPIKAKPDWCPLREVDRLMVEHITSKEDVERYGEDPVINGLMRETSKKIGNTIIGDNMCKWESKIEDRQLANRIRTTVWIVKPDVIGGCLVE